ncbi:MAG: type II secretion system protein [Armatimonadetes bacterium]|nr:type II secretion system protein [Armatimonadota bacterium]
MRRTAGMTLLEVLIANAIFLLLLGAVFLIYAQGSSAWRKGAIQAELLQQLQVISLRVGSNLEQSIYSSLTVTPSGDAVSFLVSAGSSSIDPQTGYPSWSSYEIFYHKGQELLQRDVPLSPSARERTRPGPIEGYSPDAGGPQPLTAYLKGGRVVARRIKSFRVEHIPTTQLIRLTAMAEIEPLHQDRPEKSTLSTLVRLR